MVKKLYEKQNRTGSENFGKSEENFTKFGVNIVTAAKTLKK